MSSRIAFTEHVHVAAKQSGFDTPPPRFAQDSNLVCKICQHRIYEGDPVLHGFVTHGDRRMIAPKRVTVHADCVADLRERDLEATEKKKSQEPLDIALDRGAV